MSTCADKTIATILCIGNGDLNAHNKAQQLATKYNISYHGVLDSTDVNPAGCYHTSIYDLSVDSIKIVGKKFDLVVLLDQEINEYKLPLDFHKSSMIVHELGKSVSVDFLGNTVSYNSLVNEYIQQNKSFCLFPFIAYNTTGTEYAACCFMYGPGSKIHSDNFDFYTNPGFENWRKSMLRDEKVTACKNCYQLEEQGIQSHRQVLTTEWSFKLGMHSIDDVTTRLSYYDIRLGNQCNLMCRMCNPRFSNLLAKEFYDTKIVNKDIGLLSSASFDQVDLPTAKCVYVAGGEPSINEDFKQFLLKCIDQGRTDLDIIINTNCAVITDQFLEICSKFPNLRFEISVDGFEKVNTYVRWPLKWDKFTENAKKLYAVSNKKISFNCVVSVYNISCLGKLCKYVQDNFDNISIHISYVTHTTILPAWKFPNKTVVRNSIEEIKKLPIYAEDIFFKSKIDGISRSMEQEECTAEELQRFFKFNDTLDNHRNVNLKDYIPELDACRNYFK